MHPLPIVPIPKTVDEKKSGMLITEAFDDQERSMFSPPIFLSFLVLSSSNLQVDSESTVFFMLYVWSEENLKPEGKLEKLMSCIRFRSIKPDYLYDMITPRHKWAAKIPGFLDAFFDGLRYNDAGQVRFQVIYMSFKAILHD